MKEITSFTVNHLTLLPGIYVSRIDYVGDLPVTTYDIRMKQPNAEPVLHTAEIHTMEHIGATFLRNDSSYGDDIIYFGPMGCRTGFYLIMKGKQTSEEIAPLVTKTFDFISNFDDAIPGATAKGCGYHLDMDLSMARYESTKFLNEVLHHLTPNRLVYPD